MQFQDSRTNALERIIWEPDRMLLDDLVFRIEHARNDNWDLGDECFCFYKTKHLVDQYAKFWAARHSFRSDNILEFGIWDGGSVAFWCEYFHPKKHVGVDLVQRGDSEYFRRYIAAKGLQDTVATLWGVDQADAERLRDIVDREFDGPLDLVLDDASHLYSPTKASFEVLFPLLRPGGLYIVEDWAWEHWPEFHSPDHPWATETSPTTLVNELVAATGSSPRLIASMTVMEGFVAVERGDIRAESLNPFSIERFTTSRPRSATLVIRPDELKRMLRAARPAVQAQVYLALRKCHAGDARRFVRHWLNRTRRHNGIPSRHQ
jgi:hypothetical protein